MQPWLTGIQSVDQTALELTEIPSASASWVLVIVGAICPVCSPILKLVTFMFYLAKLSSSSASKIDISFPVLCICYCSSMLFCFCGNHHNQKDLERKGFISFYNSRLHSITERSEGRNGGRNGIRDHGRLLLTGLFPGYLVPLYFSFSPDL